MKKKVSGIIIIVTLAIIFSFNSCISQIIGPTRPRYYNPLPHAEQTNIFLNSENIFSDFETREPTVEEITIFFEIYYELSYSYYISKDIPTVKVVSSEDLAEKYGSELFTDIPKGAYLYASDEIYVVDRVFQDDKSIIAYMIMNYLVDNVSPYPLSYKHNNFIFGLDFSRGVTNLLSTSYFPHTEVIYEFETEVAKLIGIAYGSDQLMQDFFDSNPELLKNDFNKALKKIYFEQEFEVISGDSYVTVSMTPYDILMGCLETYSIFIADEQSIDYAMKQVDTIIEMLLLYGESKDVREEMEQSLTKFLESESFDWEEYSNIEEMIDLS